MGMIKEKYNEYLLNKEESMELEGVERLAEKVALEPLEEDIDELDSDMDSIPEHIFVEDKVEWEIDRLKTMKQLDLFGDEVWNWSGLR